MPTNNSKECNNNHVAASIQNPERININESNYSSYILNMMSYALHRMPNYMPNRMNDFLFVIGCCASSCRNHMAATIQNQVLHLSPFQGQ